jgi:glyoxylase-like metal-dependent hydrolase (beta-lactamase superfamily II)
MLAAVPNLIDVNHQGLDRVIGAYELDGVIVDPGPESALETLLAGLNEEPRALLLTHIHLDHAGATGALVKRFPELKVYVHEVGAPHLVDPSKLLRSAGRLYDDMHRLWGEVLPVPAENIVAMRGDERVEGFKVAYTPGHASHHVSYLHEASGDAYVGDVAGVRILPAGLTLAPTPPPDIDLPAWEASLDVIEHWKPITLRLTHFGAVDAVPEQLAAVREALGTWAERAQTMEQQPFLDEVRTAVAEAAPDDIDRYELAVPPEHIWLGLERYWSRRS